MKLYIKSSNDEFLTEADYKAALLTFKQSTNPKEISKAQDIIKKYKASNPERAEKIKEELNTKRPRTSKSKSSTDPKFFTTNHMRW